MEFDRTVFDDLQAWKNSKYRKPLILKGARQVGKTSLLVKFGKTEFKDMVWVNFEEMTEIKSIFQQTKEPKRILENLSKIHGRKIVPQQTLIFFDEIQECNEALNSLKYFYEKCPEYAVVSAGSLLGITLGKKRSFPVGKVDFLDLYPLTFDEFLKSYKNQLYDYSHSVTKLEPILENFKNELTDAFKTYLICGGMPEPALHMIKEGDLALVQKSLQNIDNAYAMDFAKHADKADSFRIQSIWQSISRQLAKENKKFTYSEVLPNARSREYEISLKWLEQAGLVYKTYLVQKPGLPLSQYQSENIFKIFMLDVGLLRRHSNLDPTAFKDGNRLITEFKGALSENFILQSLIPQFGNDIYYWKSGAEAEIDFIINYQDQIIPIEVKSSEHIRSKSMAYYTNQFKPDIRIRYSLKNLDYNDGLISIPLFLADHTKKFIDIALNYKKKGILKIRSVGTY